jgi:hypothetical protein
MAQKVFTGIRPANSGIPAQLFAALISSSEIADILTMALGEDGRGRATMHQTGAAGPAALSRHPC